MATNDPASICPVLLTPTDVARLTGLALGTLMNWRSQRIGPPFIKLGRKIWYDARDLDAWVNSRRQVTRDVPQNTERKLALPVLRSRTNLDRRHRLGGHKTQREHCPDEGVRGAQSGGAGAGGVAKAGNQDFQ